MFSPLAKWYCEQKCHHQRERDCYSDAMSRVMCQCNASPGTRGGTLEAPPDRLVLDMPERLALINVRTVKPKPIVVNIMERNEAVRRHVEHEL